ncbi:MAG: histidine triad nucleotide-binding protein [Oscillospiraceae bacterium]|nr:histidine triad nucleotide-binding protein [Oscillospiraceae bacterium]
MGGQEGCVFCMIASGKLKADVVLEDGDVIAFRDIAPKAPVHVVVASKGHVRDLSGLDGGDGRLLLSIMGAVARVAESEGLREGGYRVVTNCGRDAGQSVPHLHFHVLGGGTLGDIA